MNQINNLNIIKENIEERKYWTVEEVRPYIIKYLKNIFHNGIIEREFNDVDIMIHGYNIPVEIQRTYLVKGETPNLSNFENVIRKQIDQNISISGICWFFFDNAFHEYLQNMSYINSSMNMDWFYQLFKSNTLKVFTITKNGKIKELKNEDFKFITKISNTCKLNIDEQYRILERNKSKIIYNIYIKHNLTTDEINKWYDEFENNTEGLDFSTWLSKRNDIKQKELGYIKRYGIHRLININDMLRCKCDEGRLKDASYAYNLGIIERNDKYIKCIDRYDILQYFPGYFENKELWNYWKTHSVHFSTFSSVVKGEYSNYLTYVKNQNTLMDY